MKELTREQLTEMLDSGAPVRVGLWIAGEAREFDWSDEKSGKVVKLKGVTHDIKFGPRVRAVAEELPDGFEVSTWVAPCVMGTKVACLITKMGYVKGRGEVNRGEMFLLVEKPAKPAAAKV